MLSIHVFKCKNTAYFHVFKSKYVVNLHVFKDKTKKFLTIISQIICKFGVDFVGTMHPWERKPPACAKSNVTSYSLLRGHPSLRNPSAFVLESLAPRAPVFLSQRGWNADRRMAADLSLLVSSRRLRAQIIKILPPSVLKFL